MTDSRSLLVLAAALLLGPAALEAQGTSEDYARAERFLPWRSDSLVLNDGVDPEWIGETDRFWYRRELADGAEFLLVDAAAGTRAPLFDHDRLAAALADLLKREITGHDLPFRTFDLDGDTLRFRDGGASWRCHLVTYVCAKTTAEEDAGRRSPDGRWEAYTEGYDLYVRSVETGRVVRLTDDGTRERPWASPLPSPTLMVAERTEEPDTDPIVMWSPDSRRLATVRIDARGAGTLSMVQHKPDDRVRPRHYTYYYPLPQDTVLPSADVYVFDVNDWTPRRMALDPIVMQYYGSPNRPRWTSAERMRMVVTDRGYTSRQVLEVDAVTGAVRVLVDERVEPYVDLYSGTILHHFRDRSALLWGSERDGWWHLYLYETDRGTLVRQLTRGPWVVRSIEGVDEDDGIVFFTALGREPGRDPYLRHLYRVGLDGGTPRLLTPEDADHQVSMSPTGGYVVDNYSRPNLPTVSVLRRTTDGAVVLELERADVTRLMATGWRAPAPFQAVARDDTTAIYGLIWWPSTYDSTESYPVVEQIYTGPHSAFVPKGFSAYRSTAQTIAELGFIVVQIDGLGTSRRSRAFHMYSYRNLGDGGIPDHIAAMRQMAARYPSMDLTRVGIYGHSAGGYDAAHAMLTHPDFYKVGVSSAGNHDHRMDKAVWNTQWMGWPIGDHYEAQSNVTLADRLQGKLLLAHGDVDENVPVSATIQLAGALAAANKDFDLIILTNRTHNLGRDTYFLRRRWDHFVRHLWGIEPPAGYAITPPGGR